MLNMWERAGKIHNRSQSKMLKQHGWPTKLTAKNLGFETTKPYFKQRAWARTKVEDRSSHLGKHHWLLRLDFLLVRCHCRRCTCVIFRLHRRTTVVTVLSWYNERKITTTAKYCKVIRYATSAVRQSCGLWILPPHCHIFSNSSYTYIFATTRTTHTFAATRVLTHTYLQQLTLLRHVCMRYTHICSCRCGPPLFVVESTTKLSYQVRPLNYTCASFCVRQKIQLNLFVSYVYQLGISKIVIYEGWGKFWHIHWTTFPLKEFHGPEMALQSENKRP